MITTDLIRAEFNGDNSATVYVFASGGTNIPVRDESHIKVYVTAVLKTISTHYTVSFSGTTATVTFTAGNVPPLGTKNIIFIREVPFTQDTDLVNNSLLEAESLERQLDLMVNQTQQLNDKVDRNLKLADTLIGTDATTTQTSLNSTITARANKALKFDATGNLTVSVLSLDSSEDSVSEAKSWASESPDSVFTYTDGVASAISPAVYSSKEHAVGTPPDGSAKEWATTATDIVAGGLYSAKQYAINAAASAASVSSTITGLDDTTITSPADASLLLYDTGTSKRRDGELSGDATIGDTGVITLTSNSVDSAEITAGAVDLAHMSVNSVDSDQYVNASIDSAHIGTSQITNALMADDAIDSAEIVDGAVDLVHMSVNSIDSDQYVDASIDLVHMSINSIDSHQYVDGSIDTAHIGDLQVTTGKIAADAIDSTKLADNAIDSEHYTDASIDLAHMSVNSIDSDQYVDGSIDLAHMSVNSIDSDQYVDGSIDTAHFASGSVDATAMGANSVDSSELVDGSVDLSHMSVNSIDSDQYVDASIDSAHIGNDQIDSQHYAAGSIDNEHLADDAVDSDEIAAGAIDFAHMSINSIDSDQYVDLSIDTAHIGNLQVTAAKVAADVATQAELDTVSVVASAAATTGKAIAMAIVFGG